MNFKLTCIKTSLLVIAILVAIGGVLFFFKTIVAPPSNVEQTDVYTPDVEKFVVGYVESKPESDFKSDEGKFRGTVDRISIFHSDGLISAAKRDEFLQKAVGTHFGRFNDWAFMKFNNKVWRSADHAEMRRVIRELRGYDVENGTKSALTADQDYKLSEIEGIISDYNKAWRASRNTYFGNAPRNIEEAKKYRSKPYISNCTALMKALDEMPRKVMLSHYSHVLQKVKTLGWLSSFPNRKAFNERVGVVWADIYQFKKAGYGGVHKADYESILDKYMNEYTSAAANYTWPDERR